MNNILKKNKIYYCIKRILDCKWINIIIELIYSLNLKIYY